MALNTRDDEITAGIEVPSYLHAERYRIPLQRVADGAAFGLRGRAKAVFQQFRCWCKLLDALRTLSAELLLSHV